MGITVTINSASNPLNLSNVTTQSTTVQGTGWSTAAGDASVTVTVNGETSSPFAITVRGPKTLVAQEIVDAPNSTFAYQSTLNYQIKDNLGALLPSAVPVNEFFTTGIVNDYPDTNWTRGAAGSYTASNSAFADIIQGQAANYYPSALAPRSPLSSTKVDHWGQDWRVGSTTPGNGLRVQGDTLQKYIDHARHLSIVTPDP